LRFGVPPPFQFEAPSSWLSRLALRQGCSSDELLEFLGMRATGVDVDLEMHGEALSELRRRCSLPATAFAVAGRVMAMFHRARLHGRDLLTDSFGRSRFRYCPLCLKQRRAAHLDIHWRFVAWRYCPDHNCLMDDICWRCRAPLLYPSDMMLSIAGRAGHASQRRCASCAADLARTTPCMVDPVSSTTITELEACWLLNGRALLAALCRGNASYRAEGVGTAAIGRRARDEWLPCPDSWMETERRLRCGATEPQTESPDDLPPLPYFFYELNTRWGTVLSLERMKLRSERARRMRPGRI